MPSRNTCWSLRRPSSSNPQVAPQPMKRVIAVDWSGAKSRARSKIWLAEVRDGHLTRLESGRDRRDTVAYVISDASADPDVVIGLDFAFSFPHWFAARVPPTRLNGQSGYSAVGSTCCKPTTWPVGVRCCRISAGWRKVLPYLVELKAQGRISATGVTDLGDKSTGAVLGAALAQIAGEAVGVPMAPSCSVGWLEALGARGEVGHAICFFTNQMTPDQHLMDARSSTLGAGGTFGMRRVQTLRRRCHKVVSDILPVDPGIPTAAWARIPT